jgi:hypothetical protein
MDVEVSPKYKGKNPKSKNELAMTPSQYKVTEFIEMMTAKLTGAEAINTANALQCLCDWTQNGGYKSLAKSRWYINRLIKHLQTQKDDKETKE